MDDDAPLAQADLVELGIVYIAGEAGIVPEDETCGTVGWGFVNFPS